MMTFQLTVPSKTFLLGEYAALKEGPALILLTEPYFKIVAKWQPSETLELNVFHPESPAGKLIKKHKDFYQDYAINYIDPYQGLGGFGASTAQFIMLEGLRHYVKSIRIDPFDLLDEYKTLAWNGEGLAPSGADLIGQLYGQLCYFQRARKHIQSFAWPFKELEYGLIHTGNKLATHQHLKELTRLNTSGLEAVAMSGIKSIEQKDSNRFIEAIKDYAQILQFQGLTAKPTEEILKHLCSNPAIMAAKGCGALGSDVILIIFQRNNESDVMSWLKQNKLNLVSCGYKLAEGLTIKEER